MPSKKNASRRINNSVEQKNKECGINSSGKKLVNRYDVLGTIDDANDSDNEQSPEQPDVTDGNGNDGDNIENEIDTKVLESNSVEHNKKQDVEQDQKKRDIPKSKIEDSKPDVPKRQIKTKYVPPANNQSYVDDTESKNAFAQNDGGWSTVENNKKQRNRNNDDVVVAVSDDNGGSGVVSQRNSRQDDSIRDGRDEQRNFRDHRQNHDRDGNGGGGGGGYHRGQEKYNNISDRLKYEMKQYDPAIKMMGDDKKFNSSWNVWLHGNTNPDWKMTGYTPVVYTIDSVGSLWRFAAFLYNLNVNTYQCFVMRDGIQPIWEDNNNRKGAICSIMITDMARLPKSAGDLGVDAFIAMLILTLNESFVKNNTDINGVSYSIKSRNVLIKFWVRDFEKNNDFTEKLPLPILKHLDAITSNIEGLRGMDSRNSDNTGISLQIKPIKPEH